VGTFSAMFAAGCVVGLAMGGNIIQNFRWRTMFLSIIPVAILLWFIIKRFIYNTDINQEQLIQYSPSEKSRITPAATLKQTHSTKVDSNSINDLNAPASTKFIDIKGAITLVNKKKERISIAVYPKDTLAKVDINNHRKTAIITGNCRGIGKEAAIFLAKKESKPSCIL
jgi:hypothetical protein